MKTAVKRKNYNLDEIKIKRVQKILGAKTETETLDKALDLIMFQTDLLESVRQGRNPKDITLWQSTL